MRRITESLIFFGCALLLGAGGAAGQVMVPLPAVECVQQQLSELGFYTGVVHGLYEVNTKIATDAFLVWLAETDAGWTLPPFNPRNAQLWCNEIGNYYPELAKYLTNCSPSTDISPTL